MAHGNRRLKIVRVRIERGERGLLYATSPDLRGLVVAEPNMEALEREIPAAITAMFRATGSHVIVRRADAADDISNEGNQPWVAIPAEIAAAELGRAC